MLWFRKTKKSKDADNALADAKQHLEQIKDRSPEVTKVVDSMRRVRERNHFADELYIILGGSK